MNNLKDILTYCLTFILVMFFFFISFNVNSIYLNTDDIKASEFYSQHKNIKNTLEEISEMENLNVFLNISNNISVAQTRKLIYGFGTQSCLIDYNPKSSFFRKISNQQSISKELTYFHELAHCVDSNSFFDFLKDTQYTFVSDKKEISNYVKQKEIFADVFGILVTLKQSKTEEDFNQRLKVVKNFIKYRFKQEDKTHETSDFLAILYSKLKFYQIKSMSYQDIIITSYNYKNF